MPEEAVWLMSIGCSLAATWSIAETLRAIKLNGWPRASPTGTPPHQPERQFGWVTEAAEAYVRPVKRIAVRCRKPDGTFAYGVLISALSAQQALTLTGQALCLLEDPPEVLLAYVSFSDQAA